jgi:hypothetical protein
MTIGVALLLIAAGAILRFALATVSTHGVDLHTIGDILMGVGGLGLVLWLLIWAPWARGRRPGYDRRAPAEAERPPPSTYPPQGGGGPRPCTYPTRGLPEDDYRTEEQYRR